MQGAAHIAVIDGVVYKPLSRPACTGRRLKQAEMTRSPPATVIMKQNLQKLLSNSKLLSSFWNSAIEIAFLFLSVSTPPVQYGKPDSDPDKPVCHKTGLVDLKKMPQNKFPPLLFCRKII
jgi:hypothetical protein